MQLLYSQSHAKKTDTLCTCICLINTDAKLPTTMPRYMPITSSETFDYLKLVV